MNGNPKMCLSPHDKIDFPPFFLFKRLFIYLFLAVLGLGCCGQAFFSCDRQGLLSISEDNFSLWWLLLFQSTGCRVHGPQWLQHMGSAVVSWACGILPDQGSNVCPLHWQADSGPLHHQESLLSFFHSLSLSLPLSLFNFCEWLFF